MFTGSTLVRTLVFGWLPRPNATLEELAQTATSVGALVSSRAMVQRFSEPLMSGLATLLAEALRSVSVAADPVASPRLECCTGPTSSTARPCGCPTRWPSALVPHCPGCGGRIAQHTQAACKLHVGLDLLRGRLRGLNQRGRWVHDQTAEVGP